MRTDLVVHGAGLAGCLTALAAHHRGMTVSLVHDPEKPDCSDAAAGMISPVTGRYWSTRPDTRTCLEAARRHYRAAEDLLSEVFFHELRLVRRFRNETDRLQARKRSRGPNTQWFAREWTVADFPQELDAPLGGMEIAPAYRVDLPRLTRAVRAWFRDRDGLFTPTDAPEGTRHLWARGWYETHAPPPPQEWEPVRGESLVIRTRALPPDFAWNGETFLVPLGDDRWLAGATWGFDALHDRPTPEARANLQERLQSWFRGEYDVIDHRAGVRPATRTREPVAYIDPDDPTQATLNGLGSRGGLHAPHLIDTLLDQWIASR